MNLNQNKLFHQAAWLNFLEQTQKAKILRFKMTENNKIIGYFVAFLEKRGPLKSKEDEKL
jgi:hypothetical protein